VYYLLLLVNRSEEVTYLVSYFTDRDLKETASFATYLYLYLTLKMKGIQCIAFLQQRKCGRVAT
jgi:hypothetical protein